MLKKFTIFAKNIRLLESEAKFGLKALIVKAEKLATQRDEANARLAEAQEEIADLKGALARAEEDLRGKELDIEFLSLSHKLAQGPQALAEARVTIRRLISRVDKAIALLKEDARI